jgi:hypothetical protein
MDYNSLVISVSDFCENTFPTVDMNTMIMLAEQRIYNSVQLANLRKNVTGTFTLNNKYLSCPSDFLSVYSIAVIKQNGDYVYLLTKDVNFIREAYPSASDTGLPKHYAIFGPQYSNEAELSFLVGPTPDYSYATELHYYYYPESIVTAGTTWLGDNFESALFNGTMVEAITYMKGEPDMVKLYMDRYAQSMVLLKNLGDAKQRGDAYRDGQVRNPVI